MTRVPVSQRLAERAATRLGRPPAEPTWNGGVSRRSFLVRTAVVGSALAVAPRRFILEPGTAYAAITDVCGPASECGEGYSVFCCTITNGANQCPPGSVPAGWWRADGSSWCCGGPRYYVDCNAECTRCGCQPGQAICDDACQNCQGRCNEGPTCDHRRTCVTRFRYGQCNQQLACIGNIVCRTVSCTPPYLDSSLGCTSDSAEDPSTAEMGAPCLQQASWLGRAPIRLDGVLASSPAVASAPGVGRSAVFVVGTDGNVYWSRQDSPGAGWGPWRFRGKPPPGVIGSPAAVARGPNELDVFVRGGDNRLWQQHSPNGGESWSVWFQPVPDGVLASDPAVVSWAPHRVDVFVLGTDGQIWQRFYDGQWNHAWLPRGRPLAGISGRPAVTSWGVGRIDIFVRGEDNRLYQHYYDGGWSSWLRPPGTESGVLASSPAATSWGEPEVAVFTRGTDGGLWWTHFFKLYWSGWARVGGPGEDFVGDPSAGSRGCQDLAVYVQSSNGLSLRYAYSS
ncbi:MAG: twin-arginine translocation signal domain-containing protein [Actinomycetota bacterium]|nr:twin-arginine translocation signal domain-containing protein [Actinomycetota bacterium]